MLEEEAKRLITAYQEMVTRQLCEAKETGEMDDETFDRMIMNRCTATTRQGIADHFADVFDELVAYHKNKLLERIENGAAFIDALPKDDPRYPRAVERYEALHERLQAQLDRENKYEEATQ